MAAIAPLMAAIGAASQSALRFYNLRFESLWEQLSDRSADGSDRSTDGSDRRRSLRSAASDPALMLESGIEPTPGSIPPSKLQQNCQPPVDFACSYVQKFKCNPGPQPTFTASPASARPPPMAPHVAPSLSGFSSFGQVPPMLNVNDMVAQRLRYELQQVNADIQQYTQHATFAVLSPQQLQHWNGLVERSVLLHAQLQNMGSS